MKSDSLPFGAKLRAMREKKGLGLRELAGRAKISPAFLSKIEAGKEKAPAEPKLRALAEILNVNPDVMLAMAGRLSADVVKIIQQHPKEYTALIIGLRALNQQQLQAAGRSIMETYEVEIPLKQKERMASLLLPPGDTIHITYPGVSLKLGAKRKRSNQGKGGRP